MAHAFARGLGSLSVLRFELGLGKHFSYVPVLVVAGLLAPLGTLVLFLLTGRIKRVTLKPPLGIIRWSTSF